MTPEELSKQIQKQKDLVDQMRKDYSDQPNWILGADLKREEDRYRYLLRLQVGDKKEKHERTSRTTWN